MISPNNKRLAIAIDKEIAKQLGVTAALVGLSIPKLVEAALLDYFKKHPILPSMEQLDEILRPKIAASEVSNFTTPTIDVKA